MPPSRKAIGICTKEYHITHKIKLQCAGSSTSLVELKLNLDRSTFNGTMSPLSKILKLKKKKERKLVDRLERPWKVQYVFHMSNFRPAYSHDMIFRGRRFSSFFFLFLLRVLVRGRFCLTSTLGSEPSAAVKHIIGVRQAGR